MDLQKMYEERLTPRRKVEAFRRYVAKQKLFKNAGRAIIDRTYVSSDIRLFREEALYMKGLLVEEEYKEKLTKSVRCLEEMSDEQILSYYACVRRFRRYLVKPGDLYYAEYYILEVANLIYQDTPLEACEVLLSFWDACQEAEKIGQREQEYFDTICRLFMLAHPEVRLPLLDALEERTGRDLSGRIYEAIERGDYQNVDRFVRQNVRSWKAEELSSKKNYVNYTWQALPDVFRALDTNLTEYDVRHMLLHGFYGSMYIGDYPMTYGEEQPDKLVQVSKYLYYEYQDFSDYWKCWYYVLRESVQDLLYVIYQCIESCVRKYLHLRTKKFSVSRVVEKTYATGTDLPKDVARIKEMLQDVRFQESIEAGVQHFLKAKTILPKDRDLDYESLEIPDAIDQKRLKKARADANSVLGMLREGELNYEQAEVLEERTFVEKTTDVQEEGWSQEERQYLCLLRKENREGAAHLLEELQMPEAMMRKRINEKALELFGDLLLEWEAGSVRIIEDYETEVDEILGERA